MSRCFRTSCGDNKEGNAAEIKYRNNFTNFKILLWLKTSAVDL